MECVFFKPTIQGSGAIAQSTSLASQGTSSVPSAEKKPNN